jgi:hypothetical protein
VPYRTPEKKGQAMSRNRSEITIIEEGGLIFNGTSDHVRTGFLTLAKNALFICADNVDSMDQHGYLANAEEIKTATQNLYNALMKEAGFKVKMKDRTGRLELVQRGRAVPGKLKMEGAA